MVARRIGVTREGSGRHCIPAGIPYDHLMERLNVNLPSEARAALRRLAKTAAVTEGELARELVLESLRRRERQAVIERIVAAQTPKRRKRDVEILDALERWHG